MMKAVQNGIWRSLLLSTPSNKRVKGALNDGTVRTTMRRRRAGRVAGYVCVKVAGVAAAGRWSQNQRSPDQGCLH